MGEMTVAFIALFVLALTLVVVPRLRRARRRTFAPRRGRVAMATAGTATTGTAWRRSTPAAAAAADDEWDDDLGWVDTPSDRKAITARRGEADAAGADAQRRTARPPRRSCPQRPPPTASRRRRRRPHPPPTAMRPPP